MSKVLLSPPSLENWAHTLLRLRHLVMENSTHHLGVFVLPACHFGMAAFEGVLTILEARVNIMGRTKRGQFYVVVVPNFGPGFNGP
jgi:hypothetical protein